MLSECSQTKIGTFTSAASQQTITLGFKPKYLVTIDTTLLVSNLYNADISTTNFYYSGAQTTLSSKPLGNSSNYYLYSINTNGFTINQHTSTNVGNTVYYFAIG